uniref:Uncharacterized protein n=1 Tax=Pinguiococcus pyrenoidosus TaxID=172671 RepID=A0A7R9UAQ6_9STRA
MAAACMWLLGLALLLGSPGARADDTCTAIHTGLRLNTTLENARLNAVFSLEKSNGADSVCNVDGEYKRNCRINNVEDPAVLAYKAACEDLLGELYWYDWHFRCSLSESVLWMIASYPECVPVGATCPQEIADIVFRQNCMEASVNSPDVEVRCGAEEDAFAECSFTASAFGEPTLRPTSSPPSMEPSHGPSDVPTLMPSAGPTRATMAPSLGPSASPTSIEQAAASRKSEGLGSGEVAGIVIGSIGGVILLLMFYWWCTAERDGDYRHGRLGSGGSFEDDEDDEANFQMGPLHVGPYNRQPRYTDAGEEEEEEDQVKQHTEAMRRYYERRAEVAGQSDSKLHERGEIGSDVDEDGYDSHFL